MDSTRLAEEHTNNARPSTLEKHQNGQTRKQIDAGGEKGDKNRRYPRKPPDGHKGKWPPKAVGIFPLIMACETDPCNAICQNMGLGDACEKDDKLMACQN